MNLNLDTAILLGLGLLLVYFVPAILVVVRGVRRRRPILLVNLFLGWTVLGWVAALVMALRAPGSGEIAIGRSGYGMRDYRRSFRPERRQRARGLRVLLWILVAAAGATVLLWLLLKGTAPVPTPRPESGGTSIPLHLPPGP